MAGSQDGNLGLWSGYSAGDSGWATQMDANLDVLDALGQAVIINSTTTTPPSSPSNGDAYIIPTGATGAWSTEVGNIAAWQHSAWAYYTPKAGWIVYDKSVNTQRVYNGTAWTLYQQFVSVKSFGAVGNDTADDTAAITAAINYAQGLTYPCAVYFPAGYYKVTSALPNITKGITLFGDGPRASQILFNGSTNQLAVMGSGTRASGVQFCDISLCGTSQTSGFVVVVDWAQDVLFQNTFIVNPYNGVSIRQAGDTRFIDCLIDTVSGQYGVYAYATNTTRNGQNDEIDIIIFTNTVVQSNYVAGGAANSTILACFDGRVQTIQCDGLRLLNGGIGMQTLNSPGLAENLTPRFITGSSLEIENMYQQTLNLQYCREFWVDNLWSAGSATTDGILLSSNVSHFRTNKGSINSHYLHGLNINGATYVGVNNTTIFNNSLVGAGVKDGVYVLGSGIVTVMGGLCGKDTVLPSYTENQKYGIDLDPGFTGIVCVKGVDLRGNNVGAIYDNGATAVGSSVSGCPGYNPIGATSITVGTSPFTYTSGLTSESIIISGGTVSSVTVGGVTVASASPASLVLPPRSSVIVTYSVKPTMSSVRF